MYYYYTINSNIILLQLLLIENTMLFLKQQTRQYILSEKQTLKYICDNIC